MKKKPEFVSNGLINVPDIQIEYKGYIIKAKRDFGSQPYLSAGCVFKKGYVVVKNGALATPGGGWYHSVIEAKIGIDCLIEANGDSVKFYELYDAWLGRDEWEEV
jgi:hypothetical protein